MKADDRAAFLLGDLSTAGIYIELHQRPTLLRIVEKMIRDVEQQAADCHTETLRRRTGL